MLSNEEFTDQIIRAMKEHGLEMLNFKDRIISDDFIRAKPSHRKGQQYIRFIQRFIAKHRNDAAPELKSPFISGIGAGGYAGPNEEGQTMVSIFGDQK